MNRVAFAVEEDERTVANDRLSARHRALAIEAKSPPMVTAPGADVSPQRWRAVEANK